MFILFRSRCLNAFDCPVVLLDLDISSAELALLLEDVRSTVDIRQELQIYKANTCIFAILKQIAD